MKQLELNIGTNKMIVDVEVVDNKQFVAITPICEAIGVAPNIQSRRLANNPQFNPHHMIGVGFDGKQRVMVFIPLEEVGMWLCSINARKVAPAIRDILIQFQKYCQTELHAAITGRAGIARVEALEKQVAIISQQLAIVIEEGREERRRLTEHIFRQDAEINHLRNQVQPMANVEKHIASIGGKFMAVARGTKKMRDGLTH